MNEGSHPDRPKVEREAAKSARPEPRQRTAYTLSEDETFDLACSIASTLRGGELLLLEGDLGLGKTVFARGIAAGLGVAPEDVTSPSFTLVQEYQGGRLPVFHIDLYRLDGPADMSNLGLEEIIASGAVIVAEWGDRLPGYYRRDATRICFFDMGEGSRKIEITHADPEPRRGGDA